MQAIGAFSAARGYCFAAKMIQLSEHKAGRELAVFLPTHLLMGFAIELFLKAWLLQSGVAERVLRGKAVGHSLTTLLSEAETNGLQVWSKLRELVGHFNEPHSTHQYRYMDDAAKFTPIDLVDAFTTLEMLETAVDSHVGASASRGLQPGALRDL